MLAPQDIRLDVDRCLNRGNRLSHCRLCAEACPAGAISLHGEVPELGRESCVGCGLCLGACPSGAFTDGRWSERHFLDGVRRIRAAGSRPLITCGMASERGDVSPDTFGVACCPGTFSVGVLFEAGFDGAISFLCDGCASCPLIGGFRELVRRIGRANALLAACGRPAGIVALLEREEREMPAGAPGARPALAAGPLLDVRRSASSDISDAYARRRETLTTSFFDARRTPHAGASGAHRADGDGLPMRAIPDLSPRWRADLRRFWLARVGEASDEAGPWPAIAIRAGRCVACGTCHQFCPGRAIEHRVEDGRYVISFTPGRCLGCGQCARSCVAGALTQGSAPCATPFRPQVVARYPVHECPTCHGVARGRTAGQCFWCQREDEGRRMVEDMRRSLR